MKDIARHYGRGAICGSERGFKISQKGEQGESAQHRNWLNWPIFLLEIKLHW
jgi:hypothetical protein